MIVSRFNQTFNHIRLQNQPYTMSQVSGTVNIQPNRCYKNFGHKEEGDPPSKMLWFGFIMSIMFIGSLRYLQWVIKMFVYSLIVCIVGGKALKGETDGKIAIYAVFGKELNVLIYWVLNMDFLSCFPADGAIHHFQTFWHLPFLIFSEYCDLYEEGDERYLPEEEKTYQVPVNIR